MKKEKQHGRNKNTQRRVQRKTETFVLGSQQYTKKNGEGKAEVFANAIKHGPKEQREQSQAGLDSAESRLRKSKAQFKSKNPTTRSDIIVLK